ncbi:MAG: S8/S53 family peptidase, partial [Phycisphaerales bacterium]
NRLPPGFDPEAVMKWGKYPGLGIKQLHGQGIAGKGVHVAIIDQPLLLGHTEYASQLAGYTVQTADVGPSSHGPAVAGLLVGKTCGVAPGALLHYWTVFSWDIDKYQLMTVEQKWTLEHKYRCMAVEQIIEFNRGKEKSEQIRILSVSKGLAPSKLNLNAWKTALEKAQQAGIYVFHCGGEDPDKIGFGVDDRFLGAGCRFLKDSDNPANYQPCAFLRSNEDFRRHVSQWGSVSHEPGDIFVPIDNRTRANQKAKDAYTFGPGSAASWAAPYVAGVVAMGMQVNPDLRADQVNELLYDSGWDFQTGRLINPIAFVEAARRTKVKDLKQGRERQKSAWRFFCFSG